MDDFDGLQAKWMFDPRNSIDGRGDAFGSLSRDDGRTHVAYPSDVSADRD